MRIRDYARGDAAAITRLFYETVHSVNCKIIPKNKRWPGRRKFLIRRSGIHA